MNFNTRCATNVTFYKVGSNRVSLNKLWKIGLRNSIVFVDQKILQRKFAKNS